MPVKLNFGNHDSAMDAQERLKEHFKTADVFIFENGRHITPHEVEYFISKGKTSRAKKDILEQWERHQSQTEREVDEHLREDKPLPRNYSEYSEAIIRLLKAENGERKNQGKKPLQYFFEPIDQKRVEDELEHGMALESIIQTLVKGDYEKFLEAAVATETANAKADFYRERIIGKLAVGLEKRKKVHVGVELGVMHYPVHGELKRQGTDLLEPFFQNGTLEETRQTAKHNIFEKVRRGETLNPIECAAHQLAANACVGQPNNGGKIDRLTKAITEEHVKAILAKAKKEMVTPRSIGSFLARTCKEFWLPI